MAPYHYLYDGQLSNCVSQPDTERRLDSQGDKLMERLVYRNFGGHESILAEHSVATAAHGGGVRWYEFRLNPQRDPVLYQQATHAPDGSYRWLASMAMDRRGDVGIGYSFGGAPDYPGQRSRRAWRVTLRGNLLFTNRCLRKAKLRRRVACGGRITPISRLIPRTTALSGSSETILSVARRRRRLASDRL
ncbi:MAG TPA: hypothetical protein VGP79_10105 [Bryobacteraceae bacterium]|nr:hypothetical protein [Bryobacteraceae bacterium]